MAEPTSMELTAAYRELRLRVTSLARSIDEDTADALTATCPAWSTKDLLAHMVGVATDILDGNIEGAATEAWADAQVERRQNASLAEVLDEWGERGPEIEDLLSSSAGHLPFQFFLDAWTHEWDVRQAVAAPVTVPDFAIVCHTLDPLLDHVTGRFSDRSLPAVELTLTGLPEGSMTRVLGSGSDPVDVSVSAFEFLRISMGRRSSRQIESAISVDRLPAGEWVDGLVVWSVNPRDIVDPVEE